MAGARRAGIALLIAAGASCCGVVERPLTQAESTAIARAALTTLFLEREQARELVLWRGRLGDALTLPLLAEARGTGNPVASGAVDVPALALPIPVTTVSTAEAEAHFAAHPDAWRGWYARHPASAGIVELTAPRRDRYAPWRASLLVGRACGEHCRMAWRVVVRRDTFGRWRTDSAIWLRVPRR